MTGRSGPPPGDPLERVNALSFALTQKVDDAVVAPAARAYKQVVPKPVRHGFRNFLNNLREPVVFVNYLIQFKPGKAAETASRFAINSTLGLGGVFDVAKRCPFNLPWRPNGFSDTLGVYGVGPGPFLFLPLIGPTTVRDLVGGAVDRVASPFALGRPVRSKAYLTGSNIYRVLDHRAEQEDELAKVRESEDPYSARRDLYLKKRQDRVDRLKGDASVDHPPSDPSVPSSADPDTSTPPSSEPGSPPHCPPGDATETPTFTGLRIGGSIGLNMANDRHALPNPGDAGARRKGMIVRGTVGYDLPLGKNVIVGAEIGISTGGPALRVHDDVSSYQSDPGFSLDASARLGRKLSPELLVFGKMGWAMQRVTTVWSGGQHTRTDRSTENGLFWGAGAEYALLPRTALRVEFDRVKFDRDYSRNRILGGISIRF